MRLATTLLALLFLAPAPSAQGSENVELLGQYNGRADYADTWGYTAPDGREYALVAIRGRVSGVQGGMLIVDITDATPVEVGFVPTQPGAEDSKDVKVYQNYAYLVNERGPIQIIDLTDPSNPQQVSLLFEEQGSSPDGTHNVLVANDHLWLTGGPRQGAQVGGVQVFDLVDPENPQFVSSFQPLYYHDFEIRGDIGFGPAIYGEGIDIIDVSDPSNLSIITRFNYTGSGAHNTCTSEDLSHIYVGDEIGSSGQWTRVFDITDYENENVDFVADIVVSPSAAVHNCYVRGDRLYIAHYTEGLQVYDITDPATPVRVGYYDTIAGAPNGTYSGAWSVYPYFASGKIIVSDRTNGLHVFQMTGEAVDAEDAPAASFALSAAPNPAADRTRLAFELPSAAEVTLTVTDALGREVAVLIDGSLSAGPHSAQLDASGLAPGVYVARLRADGAVATQSVVVAR